MRNKLMLLERPYSFLFRTLSLPSLLFSLKIRVIGPSLFSQSQLALWWNRCELILLKTRGFDICQSTFRRIVKLPFRSPVVLSVTKLSHVPKHSTLLATESSNIHMYMDELIGCFDNSVISNSTCITVILIILFA